MALDPALKKQLRDTIYLAAPSATSTYGEFTYAAPVSALARVEEDRKVNDGPDGSEIVTTHRFVTESVVGEFYRVWLPGEDQTDAAKSRRPFEVKKGKNELGVVEFYEVTV